MVKKKKKKSTVEKKDMGAKTVNNTAWHSKSKLLMQGLILSGALNIGLVATFIYKAASDNKSHKVEFSLRPTDAQSILHIDSRSLQEVTDHLKTLDYDKLVYQLDNANFVEKKLTIRDLALSELVGHFDLDIARALANDSLSTKMIKLGKSDEGIVIFTDMEDVQFDIIKRFAQTEKCPYTTRGLFFRLCDPDFSGDDSMKSAFYFTAEFILLETLFNHTGASVAKEDLLAMILEGSWEYLQTFTDKQKSGQNLTADYRRQVLLDYLQERSTQAAELLVRFDSNFLLKEFSDESLMYVLDQLKPSNNAISFARLILTSAQNETLNEHAGRLLYKWTGRVTPEPYDPIVALIDFSDFQLRQLEDKSTEKEVPRETTYVVRDGDNLWKIAKELKVDLDSLRSHNHLEKDLIKPGQVLVVP